MGPRGLFSLRQMAVNPVHHPMKVETQFVVERQVIEKQIHQKCFSATDATPEIDAEWWFHRGNGAETTEITPFKASGQSTRRRRRNEFRGNAIELLDGFDLVGVLRKSVFTNAGFIN